ILADARKISDSSKEKVDALLIRQGELQANLQAAEQKIAKIEQDGSNGFDRPKSMGQQVGESEAFNAWRANPSGNFRMPVQAAISEDTASAGDLIVPHRVPGIVAAPNQQLRVRDLL